MQNLSSSSLVLLCRSALPKSTKPAVLFCTKGPKPLQTNTFFFLTPAHPLDKLSYPIYNCAYKAYIPFFPLKKLHHCVYRIPQKSTTRHRIPSRASRICNTRKLSKESKVHSAPTQSDNHPIPPPYIPDITNALLRLRLCVRVRVCVSVSASICCACECVLILVYPRADRSTVPTFELPHPPRDTTRGASRHFVYCFSSLASFVGASSRKISCSDSNGRHNHLGQIRSFTRGGRKIEAEQTHLDLGLVVRSE